MLLWLTIGVVIGWMVPQPAWAKTMTDKAKQQLLTLLQK